MKKLLNYMFICSIISICTLSSLGEAAAAAPTEPVLWHPKNNGVVDTLMPTLFAYYLDDDSNGTVEFRVSSGSLADCTDVIGIGIVDTGFSAVSGSTNEVVSYAVQNPLTDTNTYSWCARGDDGVEQSAWTEMGTFTVYDTTTLLASTYLGTPGNDYGEAVDVLPSGEIVVFTRFIDGSFPTAGAGVIQNTDPSAGNDEHIAISIFDDELTTLLRSTYIGGSDNDDLLKDGAVDSHGNIYVSGDSYSSDLPQSGISTGFDVTPDVDCGDQFLLKVNSSLTDILFSTYIGGTDAVSVAAGEDCDQNFGLAVHESSGLAMVFGVTNSESLPLTANAFDTVPDGPSYAWDQDLAVSFIDTNSSGNASNILTSYVGGTFVYEWAYQDFSMDSDGKGYIGFESYGAVPFITPGAYDTVNGDTDGEGVVLKINPYGTVGNSLEYATYIGVDGVYDRIEATAVGPEGDIYVIGYSDDASFPVTPGAHDAIPSGGGDNFVYRISPDGNGNADLVAGTYVPVSSNVQVDDAGFVYIAGQTTDGALPTSADAFRSAMIGGAPRSGYIAKYNNDLTSLVYGSYYGIQGTNGAAEFNGAHIDNKGNYYVAGEVFPALIADTTINSGDTTVGAYDSSQNDNRDTFVARFVLPSTPSIPGPLPQAPSAPVISVTPGDSELEVTFDEPANNGGPLTQYQILYGESLNFPVNEVAIIQAAGADPVTVVIPALQNDVEYSVRVYAENSDSLGTYSNTVQATPTSPGGGRRRSVPLNQAPWVYLGSLRTAAQQGNKKNAAEEQFMSQAELSEYSEQLFEQINNEPGGSLDRNFSEDPFLQSQLGKEGQNLLSVLDLIVALRRLFGWMQADDYQLMSEYESLSKEYYNMFLTRAFHRTVGVEYVARQGRRSYRFNYREPMNDPTELVVDYQKSIMLTFGKLCYSEETLRYAQEIDYPGNGDWYQRYQEYMDPWLDEVLGSKTYVPWLQTAGNVEDVLKSMYLYLFGFCLGEQVLE